MGKYYIQVIRTGVIVAEFEVFASNVVSAMNDAEYEFVAQATTNGSSEEWDTFTISMSPEDRRAVQSAVR